MFKFMSFIEYATKNNLDISSSKEIRAKSYKIYRQEYMNFYNKNRKYSSARFNLTLSKEQLNFFEEKASEHNYKSIGKFIVDSAENYHKQEFLNPDPKSLQQLVLILRGVSNNVSQIARYFHQGVYTAHSFNEKILFSLVNRMEDKIVDFITNPRVKQSKED
jgi:hypothetical protein